MKTFEVTTMYSTTPDCYLEADEYAEGGHVALSVWSESEGPFANLTVNLDSTKLYPKNFNFVDTNNFPQAIELIQRLGIGRPTDRCGYSGFCSYPLYEFDMDAIKAWTEGE